jgi:hypothetical protein
MRKNQLGVSLSGLLMFAVVLIFILLLGFKLFRPYSEYFAIQKVFHSLAVKPEAKNGTKRDIMGAWASYAQIEGITSINGEDIDFAKEGNDVVISASYQTKVPLFKNFTLLIDFNPASNKSGL